MKASVWVQTMGSPANMTRWHQSVFAAAECSGSVCPASFHGGPDPVFSSGPQPMADLIGQMPLLFVAKAV